MADPPLYPRDLMREALRLACLPRPEEAELNTNAKAEAKQDEGYDPFEQTEDFMRAAMGEEGAMSPL